MKEILLLQAKYNKFANENMFSTLKQVERGLLEKNCGLYYGSIMHTAGHLVAGEIGIFIKEFSMYCDKKPSNQLLESLTKLEEIQKNVDSIASLCQKADSEIIDIIQNTNDFNKVEILSFPGISFSKSRGFLMLAILNHSTHHRGQIAAALDSFNIENDFNGMLGMPE
ncbi:hypothetical protein CCY99_04405 [Helicobacter sp. 16-1353]|uniref:DinB family protein n=1 Tax=Helicobacter sp. 16-1353 TaxID=2004996 RepID=UPI000DCC795B|nr:DinB family protein [Helicobacter sp. 16-1353]RAX54259.1 hypothetical protein CCY99_04405 [Helicobacter sp. 16-1353]